MLHLRILAFCILCILPFKNLHTQILDLQQMPDFSCQDECPSNCLFWTLYYTLDDCLQPCTTRNYSSIHYFSDGTSEYNVNGWGVLNVAGLSGNCYCIEPCV